MSFNCIDCFCGAGGLALGLSNSDLTYFIAFDIDAKAIATMRSNLKYLQNHQTEVQDTMIWTQILFLKHFDLKKGELDLLAGGLHAKVFLSKEEARITMNEMIWLVDTLKS